MAERANAVKSFDDLSIQFPGIRDAPGFNIVSNFINRVLENDKFESSNVEQGKMIDEQGKIIAESRCLFPLRDMVSKARDLALMQIYKKADGSALSINELKVAMKCRG